MGTITAAVGRFVLTWIAFFVMAILYSSLYPMLVVYSTYIAMLLSLAALGVGIHAAVTGTPRVDRSYKLLVAAVPSWYVLVRVSMYGPRPTFLAIPSSPLLTGIATYAFWTLMAGLSFGSAYLSVYRWRLLDRDGPIGHRLGFG